MTKQEILNIVKPIVNQSLSDANLYTDNKVLTVSSTSLQGEALPTDNPGSHVAGRWWLTGTLGTYTNFSGITVSANQFVAIVDTGSVYTKITFPFAVTTKTRTSKNKFDKATMIVENFLVNNPTGLASASGWAFARIPVSEGETYSFIPLAGSGGSGGRIRLEDSSNTATTYFDANSLTLDDTSTGYKITIPVGVAYLVLNVTKPGLDIRNTFQLEIGTAVTSYASYSVSYTVIELNGSPVEDETARSVADSAIAQLSDAVFNSSFSISTGKNIVNPANIVGNHLVDSSGGLTSFSGWSYVRIPVVSGNTYTFNAIGPTGGSGGRVRLETSINVLYSSFDANSLSLDITGNAYIITIPATVNYVCLNIVKPGSDITNTMQFELGNIQTLYAPYVRKVDSFNGLKFVAFSESGNSRTYIDKNVVVFGDSISSYSIPYSWPTYMLTQLYFKSFNNFARSGARWIHGSGTVYDIVSAGGSTSDDNVIWNQYNRLKDKTDNGFVPIPDVIIINAGTNDISYTLGVPSTIFTSGNILSQAANLQTSVTSGLRYTCENILSAYPDCKIIFVTPLQTGVVNNSYIFTIGDLIEECAKWMSSECLRQDKNVGIYGYDDFIAHKYLSDNLHPNTDGVVKKQGPYLVRKIKSLIG